MLLPFDDKSLHQITLMNGKAWYKYIVYKYKNILFSSYGSQLIGTKNVVEEGGGMIHIKEQKSMVAVRGERNAKQTCKVNL